MFSTRRNAAVGFRSQRSLAMGRNGMVCTSQTLASTAALDMLRRGGNAVDAAICAAAVLGVVEPFSTGIGGDCFALLWSARERRLFGINGSGRAPAALTLDLLAQRGLTAMPPHGMLPVTIPGAVDAWEQMSGRFGRLSLADVLQPAIAYARDGFPVTEIIQHQWDLIVRFGVLRHPESIATLTRSGEAPVLGELFRMPALADSLALIAAGGAEAFYRGPLAQQIVDFSQANGGVHQRSDFAEHHSTWVEPISTTYRDYELYEIPPNGQGLAALVALNILESFDVTRHPLGSADNLHLRIEAVKLAYADRGRYIADPDHGTVPTAALLTKEYARRRARLIEPQRALATVGCGEPSRGDTVYLTTADRDGNVVSFINSLYMPFGSGMVVPDTGIVLQNRGYGFVTDPSHPNCVAPRKRPFHTIIPAMLMRDHVPIVAFGVMGGDVQAQAHLQVVSNLVDFGLNIQEALDYPRFNYFEANQVAFENSCDAGALAQLRAMGHEVLDEQAALLRGSFGGGQGIMIDPAGGTYWGGSDCRKDGCALGY